VAEKIVGGSFGDHGGALTRLHGADAIVVQIVNRVVEENATSNECSLDIVNVLVGPGDCVLSDSVLFEHRGLRAVQKRFLPDFAFALNNSSLDNLVHPCQSTAVRWVFYELVVEVPEKCWQQEEDDSWQEKGEPESDEFLAVDCRNREECANIDETIEDQHGALHCDLRVHYDMLAST